MPKKKVDFSEMPPYTRPEEYREREEQREWAENWGEDYEPLDYERP